MIYINLMATYKQFSHHHTKRVNQITRAYTRCHTYAKSTWLSHASNACNNSNKEEAHQY